MPDWSASMQQTFEYYTVDPNTWRDRELIQNIKSCTITRDSDAETLGSATIDIANSLGESYIRVYLITIQNGVKEKHPLGTFLVQTPSSKFNGKLTEVAMDAYTPLLELKENPPPLGYSILKGENIMERACRLIRENARAPLVVTESTETLAYDFVANVDDTWLSFLTDLIERNNYIFDLDEMGRILFLPKQDTASLQPVYTYDDGNSSILHPEMSMDHDMYDIPNVIEVIYSSDSACYEAEIRNDDPNSPTSTINRGRVIKRRISNPDLVGEPSEALVKEYAEQLLRELSTLEYTITYTHAYCPVRVGDCVRINNSKYGLSNVKAKVIHQNIKCETGCQVTEKAIFTTKLWR